MKIRELIEKLEKCEKDWNNGAHPSFDRVTVELEFQDRVLDDRNWDVSIESVESWFLGGCGCEVDAIIKILIK